jgi:AraC family transcriptional regulator
MPYKNNKKLYEEYLNKINKTLDYIQRNISEKISLADLSKISGFSNFHFLRIFTALIGETPGSYIKRIRVEKVANLILTNSKLTITQIAFKCGYSSSQSLSRDFRDYFKVSPSQYKVKQESNICHIKSNKGKATLSEFAYDGIKGRDLINHQNEKNMEVKIQDFSEIAVAYIRHIGKFKGDSSLFGSAFEKLCSWAYPNGLINEKTLFLAAYYDDPKVTSEDKMRIDICMSIPADAEPSNGIGKTVFSAGKYAVSRIEAKDTADFEKGWNELYRNWLLGSGHEPDNNRPCLEIYRNDPKKDKSGKYIVDICVPIK